MEILSKAYYSNEPAMKQTEFIANKISVPANALITENTVSEAVPKEIEKKSIQKSKKNVPASLKKNERNSLLHQRMKEAGTYASLNTLQFGINQYKDVDNHEFKIIMQLADQLIFDESLQISIAGFTDNTGNTDYNMHLSMLRAQNIKQYMLDLGVSEKQIIVSGNGITNPAASNNTEEGRSTNRRVEMLLIPS